MPRADTLDQQHMYMHTIITAYILTAVLWLIMFAVHLKWKTPNSFTGLGFAFIWVLYAYSNYRYSDKGHLLDAEDLRLNCERTLALLACSFMMCMPYFKHVNNFINRTFRKNSSI